MDRRLLVMSVTRLSDGVCVACVDEHNTWVRPTRDKTPGWRQLDARDLRDARGQVVVKVGHIVDWPVGPPAPQGVHVEDVLVTCSPPRPAATLTHDELLRRCGDLCELDLADFLRSVSYLHLVPQVVREEQAPKAGEVGPDPYGRDLLDQIRKQRPVPSRLGSIVSRGS